MSVVISAIHPVIETPSPPTPTARPSIRPETTPTFPGAISCAIATVTAKVDTTKSPIELTVTSDKRKVSVVVTAVGESVTATGVFPVVVEDDSGREWTLKSDDGATAVYTG